MFVSFVDPFAKSYEKISPDEVLVYKEKLKAKNCQALAKATGRVLILSILVLDGVCNEILLQRFLVSMRDHFGNAEKRTSMYKVFLNALVATSWKTFAGDIVVKSRDAIKLHQEK